MSGTVGPMFTSLLNPILPFKCYGNGCACDLAGKELPGCGCFVTIQEKSTSCSTADSCCSTKKEPSKQISNDKEKYKLFEIACNRKNNDSHETLERHCKFEFKTKVIISIISIALGRTELLTQNQLHCDEVDKIPIPNFS